MTILLALACIAVDGDTLRCRVEGQTQPLRVRLLGIDAPELPAHCRKGRTCAPGDPVASTRSLARAIYRQRVAIQPVTLDHYGRTVARASTPAGDLSCHQLRARAAVYVPHWDNGRAVARQCPEAVR